MDVKILTYTKVFELEGRIKEMVDSYKFQLLGPVTVGTNKNGSMVYVATMIKRND